MKQAFSSLKGKLSLLWLFAMLNYLYCDVLSLMDSEVLNLMLTGDLGFMKMTQALLLGSAVLMEIPIAMVILSRFLKYKINRITNIIAGSIMTIVQTASLFAGTPTWYYLFFSIIEISTTAAIVCIAWKWIEK